MLIRRGRWTVEERIRKMVWGKGEERNVGRARKEKIEGKKEECGEDRIG